MQPNNIWVFCCGMFRSGSTLQYQMTSTLVEKLNAGVRSRYLSENEFPLLIKEYENASGYIVLKAHLITPPMAALLGAGKGLSIGIFRDIRDVAVSMMKMWNLSFDDLITQKKLEEAIASLDAWSQHPGHMVSKYEILLKNPIDEIKRIASHLNLSCSKTLAREIADDLTLEKNIKRVGNIAKQKADAGVEGAYWDPHSLLHYNHIFSGVHGAWKEELTKDQVLYLDKKFRAWLLERGYPLSNYLVKQEGIE